MFPVRCFSCNKVIGPLWDEYKRLKDEANMEVKDIFEILGLKRYCCRRMMLGHVEIINNVLEYSDIKKGLTSRETVKRVYRAI